MGTYRQQFYATRGDLEEILSNVEAKAPPLKFAPTWETSTEQVKIHESLRSYPKLGVATAPSSISNHSYFVLEKDRPIIVEAHTRSDCTWYSCEIGERSAVIFRPAGVLTEGTLIMSEVNLMSDDPANLKLFKLFRREIKCCSTMVQSISVCKEAEKLLDMGWILTDMANTVIKRHLKRPTNTNPSNYCP